MRRRNPHVFARRRATRPPDAAAVNEVWQAIKAAGEAARVASPTACPPALPALLYADKVLEPAGRGRAVAAEPDRARRPAAGPRRGGARRGVDPEQALRDAVRRLG